MVGFPPPFHGFPRRENCDPTNPYEAFLWMLVALPQSRGSQLVMPVAYLQLISKRLWDCGARPAEKPVVKYRPPAANSPHWLSDPGTWVGVEEPDIEENPIAAALDTLTAQQQAEVFAELERRRDAT